MKYPVLNSKAQQVVNIPDFDGGINLAEAISAIEDNQLTDALNVWYEGGYLKTRPDVKQLNDRFGVQGKIVDYKSIDTYLGGVFSKVIVAKVKSNENDTVRLILIKVKPNGNCFVESFLGNRNYYDDIDYCIYQGTPTKADGIYIIASYRNDETVVSRKVYEVTKNFDASPYYIEIADSYFYRPTVLLNLKGNNYTSLPTNEQTVYSPATQFEGFNMLYGAFRAYATSDDISNSFTLPFSLADKRVKVTIKGVKGFYKSNIPIEEDIVFDIQQGDTQSARDISPFSDYTAYNSDGTEKVRYYGYVCCFVDRENGKIYFKNTSSTHAQDEYNTPCPIPIGAEKASNIEIEAFVDVGSNFEKLAKMTVSTTYDAGGVYGVGSRSFLAGNEDEKSLIVWSDCDKPTYFSENCYAYVGNPNVKVTAFGKQNGLLVVFKESEILISQYQQGDSIESEQMQSNVDVTATAAKFPFYYVSDKIGCDVKDSVQLCLNRLVWANTNGEVYTLVSTSNQNEKNIYPLSRTISRMLKNADLKNAMSADWNGYYMLYSGKDIFLMDYQKNSFKYVYSYNKNSSNSSKSVCWWHWSLDKQKLGNDDEIKEIIGVYSNENDMTIVCKGNDFVNNGFDYSALYAIQFDEVNSAHCYSMIKTKLFDMGFNDRKKNIDSVSVIFGNRNSNDGTLNVAYITDSWGARNGQMIYGQPIRIITQAKEREAQYGELKTLKPHISRTRLFGICFECDYGFSIDNMQIRYSILGVIK